MMIRSCLFLAGGAVATILVACSTQDTASSDLSIEAATLAGAEDSLATTEAAAKACFDTFKTCADAATDDTAKAACRDALKTCLPADAKDPGKCGGRPRGGEGKDGKDCDGGGPPRGDAGERPEGPRPDDDKGGKGPRGGEGGGRPEGPPPDGDVDGGGGGRGHGHRGHDGECKPPPVPRDRLEKCRDDASASTDDSATAADAHTKCVKRAFGDQIAEICKRAADACAKADANAEVCATITTLCASATAAATVN